MGGKEVNEMEIRMVNLKDFQVILEKHHKRLGQASGLTPGDVRMLSQDLIRVLGEPLPEMVTALFVRVVDMSPVGGKKWITGWLERTIIKIEVMRSAGLQELEAGYVGTVIEPARLPGERQAEA